MTADANLKDPVCGMTVPPDSRHKFTYRQQEYYFCSGRCRDTFSSDPAAYLAVPNPPAPDQIAQSD